jgi:hypothetical protein
MSADAATSQARSTVEELIRAEIERRRDQLTLRERRFSIGSWVGEMAWLLWDPFDALLRRWQSDRVWGDLATGRISHGRAARELARIAQRQRTEDSAADPTLVP